MQTLTSPSARSRATAALVIVIVLIVTIILVITIAIAGLTPQPRRTDFMTRMAIETTTVTIIAMISITAVEALGTTTRLEERD